jgi:hypothetical protein
VCARHSCLRKLLANGFDGTASRIVTDGSTVSGARDGTAAGAQTSLLTSRPIKVPVPVPSRV